MARLVVSGFVLMIVGTAIVSMIALIAHRPTRKIGLGMLVCAIVLPALLVGGIAIRWSVFREPAPLARFDHDEKRVIHSGPSPRGDRVTTLIAGPVEDFDEPRIDLDGTNPSPPVGRPPAPQPPANPAAKAPQPAVPDADNPLVPQSPSPTKIAPTVAKQQLPSWVTEPHSSRGTNSWAEVVSSSPVEGFEYAQQELDEQMIVATGHVLDDLLGDHVLENKPPGSQLQHARRELAAIGIGPREIRRRFLTEECVETRWSEALASEMQLVHLKLEFEPKQRDELLARWQANQSERRLGKIGIVGASLLIVLAGFYSALRIDTATKGYYSKRLLLGATLVTMAVAAVNFMLFTR